MLLFGVAITSYIMDNLNSMILKIRQSNKSFEEADQLCLFLGTMERFNDDLALPEWLSQQFEKYFEYRWAMHRNHAISTVEDKELLEQLPLLVQT